MENEKLNVETIRKLVKQLKGKSVLPKKDGTYYGVTVPRLRGGIVWFGLCAVHPETYIDVFGIEEFRKLPKDISDEQMEKFINEYRSQN